MTTGAVFLCTAADIGLADTCCLCGGSASLGGTQDPIPGSVPSLRYCSTECHDEWEDELARRREQAERQAAEDEAAAAEWDGVS
jgi:hypothetical protein